MSSNQTNTPADSKIKRRADQLSPDFISIEDGKQFKKHCEMSNEKVGDKTMGELLSAFSQLIQNQLSTLATKGDFEEIRTELILVKQENASLRNTINEMAARNDELADRLEYLELQNRRKSLIFKGVQCTSEEDPKQGVSKICSDILNLKEPMGVDKVIKIGPKNLKASVLLVEFDSNAAATNVLKNCRKLKGTKIVIHRDYPSAVRQKRQILFKIRQDLITVDKKVKIFIRDDKLEISGHRFTWNNNKLINGMHPAREKILSLFTDQEKVERILSKYEVSNGEIMQASL